LPVFMQHLVSLDCFFSMEISSITDYEHIFDLSFLDDYMHITFFLHLLHKR
jgi:hypothetical protein